MTVGRLLLVVAMTFAAIQIAAADEKKAPSKQTTKGSFEVKDNGFDVSSPTTISKKTGNTSSLGRNTKGSVSKH
jgi:hypothetical protein